MSSECAICMEPIPSAAPRLDLEAYGPTVPLTCGHEDRMHEACLRRWLVVPGRSCPLCRASVVDSPTQPRLGRTYLSGRAMVRLQRIDAAPSSARSVAPFRGSLGGRATQQDRYPGVFVHSASVRPRDRHDDPTEPDRGTIGGPRFPRLACGCRAIGLYLAHLSLVVVMCVSLLLRSLRRILDALIRLTDGLEAAHVARGPVSQDLRDELAAMSLRELRAKSVQLGVSAATLRQHRRVGENLARRNDYATVLLRAVQ